MVEDWNHTHDVLRHQNAVSDLMRQLATELTERGDSHDASKLCGVECEWFSVAGPPEPYGTEAYEQKARVIHQALEAHYANNDHHPEHWPNGFVDMPLLAVIEMFCCWVVRMQRTQANGGNWRDSLKHLQERFGIPMLVIIWFERLVTERGWLQ